MHHLKTVMEIVQACFTCGGILGAALWALYIFKRQREDKPRVEFTADIVFHKRIGDWWIVELLAYIENKGKVQHRLYNLDFDLASIDTGDQIVNAPQFADQAFFPHPIIRGSFKRADMEYFFIEPGVKGKYSFIARVPVSAEVILLHAYFNYNKIEMMHGAEKTAIVPR